MCVYFAHTMYHNASLLVTPVLREWLCLCNSESCFNLHMYITNLSLMVAHPFQNED